MFINELQKRGLRKDPVYQTVIQDLITVGAISAEKAVCLMTTGPRGIIAMPKDVEKKAVEKAVATEKTDKLPKPTIPYKVKETVKA